MMEYQFAVKKNEFLLLTTKWMQLGYTILNETKTNATCSSLNVGAKIYNNKISSTSIAANIILLIFISSLSNHRLRLLQWMEDLSLFLPFK